jgi:hypothetical protein
LRRNGKEEEETHDVPDHDGRERDEVVDTRSQVFLELDDPGNRRRCEKRDSRWGSSGRGRRRGRRARHDAMDSRASVEMRKSRKSRKSGKKKEEKKERERRVPSRNLFAQKFLGALVFHRFDDSAEAISSRTSLLFESVRTA